MHLFVVIRLSALTDGVDATLRRCQVKLCGFHRVVDGLHLSSVFAYLPGGYSIRSITGLCSVLRLPRSYQVSLDSKVESSIPGRLLAYSVSMIYWSARSIFCYRLF